MWTKLAIVSVALVGLLAPADAFSSFAGQRLVSAPVSSSAVTMKIFDWKTRGTPGLAPDAGVEFFEHTVGPAPGSHKRKKRKGRGISAGQGASCGFGMRGQKSRAGRPTRPGFEGGQTPLYRRLPKYVGRPMGPGHQKTEYALIKTEQLNKMDDNATVNSKALMEAHAITKDKLNIYKVVGGAELTKKGLTVEAHAFTASAKAAIEANGGKCVVLSQTTHKPVEA